jgi:hypothetical protein
MAILANIKLNITYKVFREVQELKKVIFFLCSRFSRCVQPLESIRPSACVAGLHHGPGRRAFGASPATQALERGDFAGFRPVLDQELCSGMITQPAFGMELNMKRGCRRGRGPSASPSPKAWGEVGRRGISVKTTIQGRRRGQ